MHQEGPTSETSSKSTKTIQTGNNNDTEFYRDVKDFFGWRIQIESQNGDESSGIFTRKLDEFQRPLEQLGVEARRAEIKPEDVAPALTIIAKAVNSSNPILEPNLTPEISERFENTRKLFMQTGEKLWPNIQGNEQEFGLARVRLNQKLYNGEAFTGALEAGKSLYVYNRGEGGSPLSVDQQRKNIDHALGFAQDNLAQLVYHKSTHDNNGHVDKDGSLSDEDKKFVAGVLKDVYIVEKYKDKLK